MQTKHPSALNTYVNLKSKRANDLPVRIQYYSSNEWPTLGVESIEDNGGGPVHHLDVSSQTTEFVTEVPPPPPRHASLKKFS